MKKLLLSLALIASTQANANWDYIKQIDPMTDADTSIVASYVDGKILMVTCENAGFEIIANIGYLGSRVESAMFRFDKESPIKISVIPSTNGKAFFVKDDDKKAILDGLKKHSKVTILANDFQGTPNHKSFNLVGFTEKAAKLECLK